MRANGWICARISALVGRSSGLTPRRHSRLAALRLAVKYSDSTRSYISRAASRAIAWRNLPSLILSGAVIKPINAARGSGDVNPQPQYTRVGSRNPGQEGGRAFRGRRVAPKRPGWLAAPRV